MPIYYVIYTSINYPGGWYIGQILKVIETTMEAFRAGEHNEDFASFHASGQHPQSMIFAREPDNPFRDQTW